MAYYRLTLPYPPSSNARLKRARGGGVRRSDEANVFKSLTMSEMIGMEPLKGDIYVVLEYYRPRKSGDLQNYQKELFDVLQQKDTQTKGKKPYSAYFDDDQIVSFHPTRYEDKKNPRVEVMVTNDLEIYTQVVIESLALLKESNEK